MAKNNSLPDFLTDLANTIREVEGTSEPINPQDFSDRVRAIGANGGGGAGDIQAVIDGFIDGTITEVENDTTSIGTYKFYQFKNLQTANFPNVTSIGNYAFSSCSALTTINSPNVTSLGNSVFHSCFALTTANFPKLTSMGTFVFAYCNNLTTVNLPYITSITNNAFSSNFALKKIIIGTSLTTVVSLANASAFNSCYHLFGTTHSIYNPTGAKDGYIYVPLSLVANYRSATNWSTFASQIMPYVATVEELASIDGTTYDKACVGTDYVEYTYNGTSWEVYR